LVKKLVMKLNPIHKIGVLNPRWRGQAETGEPSSSLGAWILGLEFDKLKK